MEAPDIIEDEAAKDTRSSGSRGNRSKWTALLNSKPPWWLMTPLIYGLFPFLLYAVLYLLLGEIMLPEGEGFPLFLIVFCGIPLGMIVKLCKLPPLLGMLTLGIVLRNVRSISYAKDLDPNSSAPLRELALVIILSRAGLGLDPGALMRLKVLVLRLAFTPCLVEACTTAITTHFILGYPWEWGFLLGFILAAVSPAVVVPGLLELRNKGYGIDKGIPTIVIAAASVDDILAISLFGLTLSFVFSSQTDIVQSLIQGPLEVAIGVLYGVVYGSFLGIFLGRPEEPKKDWNSLVRVSYILLGGALSVFGFQKIGYPGSGALGCLSSAFIASLFWRKHEIVTEKDGITKGFSKLWYFFQPILFGLIGCEINVDAIDVRIVGWGCLCLAIGVFVRVIISFSVVTMGDLNLNEKIFIAFAWLPKATVQAAIGPVALDTARKLNAGKDALRLGLEVLTIAVLSILITAPVGATLIKILGPRLLKRSEAYIPDSLGNKSVERNRQRTKSITEVSESVWAPEEQ